jgi:hypothetical protein
LAWLGLIMPALCILASQTLPIRVDGNHASLNFGHLPPDSANTRQYKRGSTNLRRAARGGRGRRWPPCRGRRGGRSPPSRGARQTAASSGPAAAWPSSETFLEFPDGNSSCIGALGKPTKVKVKTELKSTGSIKGYGATTLNIPVAPAD